MSCRNGICDDICIEYYDYLFLLICRGDPEPLEMLPQFYDHLSEWLNLIPLSLGARKYANFHQYGTGIERKTARNDPEILNKAKKTGLLPE